MERTIEKKEQEKKKEKKSQQREHIREEIKGMPFLCTGKGRRTKPPRTSFTKKFKNKFTVFKTWLESISVIFKLIFNKSLLFGEIIIGKEQIWQPCLKKIIKRIQIIIGLLA